MPVTARLSQRFYEKLGDDVAKELVDWFNDVDASYRAELREFNELNFARFDAKVEQRFAQADAKMEQRFAQAEARSEQRLAQFKNDIELRISGGDDKLGQRIDGLEQRIAGVEVKLEARIAGVEVKLESMKSELIKWMFLFWTGSALANLLIRR